MGTSFNAYLLDVVRHAGSNLCVGLDPDVEKLVAHGLIEHGAAPRHAVSETCRAIINATTGIAAAYKPNAAFFEAEDADLAEVAKTIKDSRALSLSICDAKRGDIGNTSSFYSRALFEKAAFDAVTINPLMGYDSVEPFLVDPRKGVFLLCLTSNPGASDFLLQNELYKRIAEKAVQWNRHDNVGLVVGATRPEFAETVRNIAPDLPLLIPGIGAQGGSLSETLDAIGAKTNRRFLINASRSIMFPQLRPGETYADAITRSARTLSDEITQLLDQ